MRGLPATSAAERGTDMTEDPQSERSRRVRRSALLLGGVALAFYVAFILMSVLGVRA